MGGGQTQFYEMFRAGLSFVADPAQVIFTIDERLVVEGVLNGDFEVGFARTDQIERHTNANGETIDPGMSFLLKIVTGFSSTDMKSANTWYSPSLYRHLQSY